FDPGVRGREQSGAPARTHREHRSGPLAVTGATPRALKRTPANVLKGLNASGALDRTSYLAARDAYDRAKSLGRKLSGRRGLELAGLHVADDGAAGRAAAPAVGPRRRHRVGVLLRLRRRQAALDLEPLAGHRPAVHGARGGQGRPRPGAAAAAGQGPGDLPD